MQDNKAWDLGQGIYMLGEYATVVGPACERDGDSICELFGSRKEGEWEESSSVKTSLSRKGNQNGIQHYGGGTIFLLAWTQQCEHARVPFM